MRESPPLRKSQEWEATPGVCKSVVWGSTRGLAVEDNGILVGRLNAVDGARVRR
jgi:hypothetical protein